MLKKINKISTLRVNLFSNYFSSVLIAILSIVFVPIYLKHIGTEGYGLIGVFASLQVILSVLDGGLGGALTKEIAHHSADPSANANKIGDIVKTLGTIYWLLALVIGIIAVCLSPVIAKYWVKPVGLSHNDVVMVFILLSASLIFYFPIGFYSGGMIGMQKQLILNLLKIGFTLLKNIGSVVVLVVSSEKLISFFVWNLVVSAMQALVFKMVLWNCLPERTQKAKYNKQELKEVWKFAMGMTGISITALILTQVDRVILSKVLTLDQFGCYTLAGSVAVMIFQIIQPINQSFFPKFAALTRVDQSEELQKMYRLGYQVVSLLIVPATLALVFFSKELLYFLTNDLKTTESTWLILSALALGNGLNALLNIPYQLSLAFSWTKFAFYQNIALIILMTPLTIWLSLNHGAIGGACSWLILNVLMILIGPIIIHNKILKNELFKWYSNGLWIPLLTNGVIFFAFRVLFELDETNKHLNLILISFFGLVCLLLNSMMLPEIRVRIKELKIFRK